MKLKVQAQSLQPGDVVGSGEKVLKVVLAGISIPAGKCEVVLENQLHLTARSSQWGKYTMISVERPEQDGFDDLEHIEGELEDRSRE